MIAPVGILFAAASITAEWFVGLNWRLYGARFVRAWKGTDDPIGGYSA